MTADKKTKGKLVEIDDFPDKDSEPKTTWWVKLNTSSGVIDCCYELD